MVIIENCVVIIEDVCLNFFETYRIIALSISTHCLQRGQPRLLESHLINVVLVFCSCPPPGLPFPLSTPLPTPPILFLQCCQYLLKTGKLTRSLSIELSPDCGVYN